MNTIYNLLAKTLLISSLSLSFNVCLSANNKENLSIKSDTNTYLQIQGTIFIENKEVKGNYQLEVMYFDSVISTLNVKNNMPVNLHLKKDMPYILKISKKGFIPRYISLNTTIQGISKTNEPYNFYFETDFISVKEAMLLDSEALEMPIAIIAYNPKKEFFEPNRNYTLFVKQRLYAGLHNPTQLSAMK